MPDQRVGLQLNDDSPRAGRAREDVIESLGDVPATEPDEGRTFEVVIDAPTPEDALERVWNAIAAAGADDHVVLLEHPDVPRHWEHRPSGDEPPQG